MLVFMPMATPEVVLGSSLLTLFVMIEHLRAGSLAVTIAHIMFCISFVVVTVKARLASLDPRLEEAAGRPRRQPGADLPAGHASRSRFPGILARRAAGVLASFDDFIITNFKRARQRSTFPMFV